MAGRGEEQGLPQREETSLVHDQDEVQIAGKRHHPGLYHIIVTDGPEVLVEGEDEVEHLHPGLYHTILTD